MSEKLLPCPHCGSEAHAPTQWPSYDGPGVPIPRCRNPECLAEACNAEAWNRRTPTEPVNARLLAAAQIARAYVVDDEVRAELVAAIAEAERANPAVPLPTPTNPY